MAVLGAGLMGHGIAQVAAQAAKYEVSLRDVRQEFLDKKRISEEEMSETLGRVHPTLDLREAVADADLIIEVFPRTLRSKKRVYRARMRHARLFAPQQPDIFPLIPNNPKIV